MARIEGTGPKEGRRLPRLRLRRPSFPPPVIAVLAMPVVVTAPDEFLRAVSALVLVGAAFAHGFYEGRSAMAREFLRDVRPDDR